MYLGAFRQHYLIIRQERWDGATSHTDQWRAQDLSLKMQICLSGNKSFELRYYVWVSEHIPRSPVFS